jgi:hypothetical protein
MFRKNINNYGMSRTQMNNNLHESYRLSQTPQHQAKRLDYEAEQTRRWARMGQYVPDNIGRIGPPDIAMVIAQRRADQVANPQKYQDGITLSDIDDLIAFIATKRASGRQMCNIATKYFDGSCAICTLPKQLYEMTQYTSCGHTFCSQCVSDWQALGHRTCPMCKSESGVCMPTISTADGHRVDYKRMLDIVQHR